MSINLRESPSLPYRALNVFQRSTATLPINNISNGLVDFHVSPPNGQPNQIRTHPNQTEHPLLLLTYTLSSTNKNTNQVLEHGTKHWGLIGSQLNGRTGKQCRERWHNQLDPAIRKDPWTRDEEDILLKAHAVVRRCDFFVWGTCCGE
jgi:hypothetical protein